MIFCYVNAIRLTEPTRVHFLSSTCRTSAGDTHTHILCYALNFAQFPISSLTWKDSLKLCDPSLIKIHKCPTSQLILRLKKLWGGLQQCSLSFNGIYLIKFSCISLTGCLVVFWEVQQYVAFTKINETHLLS